MSLRGLFKYVNELNVTIIFLIQELKNTKNSFKYHWLQESTIFLLFCLSVLYLLLLLQV